MHVKSVFLHNWANLPDDEYHPGPLTIVTGGNGSGKTTFGDAVQTIMTAARTGLFKYNPGQDEASQQSRTKSHRTLGSYILGCDDNAYARVSITDGYLGINFEPGAGENGLPFAAVICARANLNHSGSQRTAHVIRMEMYLFPNRHLSLQDLKSGDGEHWLDLERDFKSMLSTRFGKANVEHFTNKEHYLCRLYALLLGKAKGGLPAHEMKQMVRAFVKFMAYQPVKNLDDFVRGSVLDAIDNGEVIKQISSMMKTIGSLRVEADHIASAVSVVQQGQEFCHKFIRLWLKRQENRAIAAAVAKRLKHAEYLQAKQRQQQLNEAIDTADRQIRQLSAEFKTLDEQRVEVSGRCRGLASYRNKQELETQIDATRQNLAALGIELVSTDNQLQGCQSALIQLLHNIQSSDSSWRDLLIPYTNIIKAALSPLEAAEDLGQLVRQPDLEPDYVQHLLTQYTPVGYAIDELHRRITEADSEGFSLTDRVKYSAQKADAEAADIARERKNCQSEIEKLQGSAAISYPRQTAAALKLLREKYPNCNPRVIGNHIDILDDSWQNAIEGYMGGARFNIVVDAEYEADAIRLVNKLAGNAKVVQGERCHRDARQLNVKERSIVQLMDFDDEIVHAYVTANYWNVQQVDSAEELRRTARGLTRDGMGSGAYAMFGCMLDDANLMCGKGARQRRLAALQNNLLNLEKRYNSARDRAAEAKRLIRQLAQTQPTRATTQLESALAALQTIDRHQRQLADIDLSAFAELEARLEEFNVQCEQMQERINEQAQSKGGYLAELYGQDKDPEKPSNESLLTKVALLAKQDEILGDKADEALILYVDWRRHEEDFDEGQIMDAVESTGRELEQAGLEALQAEMNRNTAMENTLRHIRDTIAEYNQQPVQQNQLINPFETLLETGVESEGYYRAARRAQADLDHLYQRLNNHILVRQQDTLRDAQAKFDQTFTNQLLQEILSQINQSTKTLTQINRELQHHKFDDETYEFCWDRKREFENYFRCFNEVMQIAPTHTGEHKTLFEDEALSPETREILDSLKKLLLQDDNVKAHNELLRIADYRNYHTYDILKKPEGKEPIRLSTYGTGSGGQLETPFYVIMAAAFQSAMRFHEGKCHLRTIIIDESFSKLDEKRSRRILDYLTDKLGLQVIFILPTNKSGPFKGICTHQFVVQKIDDRNPPPGSELLTRVLVDQQLINREKVATLFESHRHNVSQQVELDFLKLLDREGKAGGSAGKSMH